MKSIILLLFTLFSTYSYSQCLAPENEYIGLDTNFISYETQLEYWSSQFEHWTKVSNEFPDSAYAYYMSGVSKWNSLSTFTNDDLTKIDIMITKAILTDPTEPLYYAVNGLLKYCKGITSKDKMKLACWDLNKAIELNIPESIRNSESFSFIYKQNCEE